MNIIPQLAHLTKQGYTVVIKETLGATVVLVTEPGRKKVRGRQLVNTDRTVALGRAGAVAEAVENAYILVTRNPPNFEQFIPVHLDELAGIRPDEKETQ